MGKLFQAHEVLKTAVTIEKNGYRFYRELANQVSQLSVKETFEYLANEEKWHIDAFSALLERTPDHQVNESFAGEQEEYLAVLAGSHVFNDNEEFLAIIKNAKTDIEVIALAETFEKDSILFYLEMLELLPEEEQAGVHKLIKQEKGHLRKLRALKNNLKTVQ